MLRMQKGIVRGGNIILMLPPYAIPFWHHRRQSGYIVPRKGIARGEIIRGAESPTERSEAAQSCHLHICRLVRSIVFHLSCRKCAIVKTTFLDRICAVAARGLRRSTLAFACVEVIKLPPLTIPFRRRAEISAVHVLNLHICDAKFARCRYIPYVIPFLSTIQPDLSAKRSERV